MPYEDRGHQSGGYMVYWRKHEEGNDDRLWNKVSQTSSKNSQTSSKLVINIQSN